MKKDVILKINNLSASFKTDKGRVFVVENAGFELHKGETLGIVGESGCGKSVTALCIMRLLPKPSAVIESGTIEFKGENLLKISLKKMQLIRGRKISMIFQEPMTALNPVYKIGKQIIEVYKLHFSFMTKKQMKIKAINMLTKVGIADPDKVMNNYPHQLSGGMCQRIIIAIALASEPDILIADEPTTALDVTVQSQILDIIKELKKKSGMSVILISHDLGVIAENCDKVVVMYAGNIVEKASIKELFKNPFHPYTEGLIASMPCLSKTRKTMLPTIDGIVPALEDMPLGCRFNSRCLHAKEICKKKIPKEKNIGNEHYAFCHFLRDQRTNLKLQTCQVQNIEKKTEQKLEQGKCLNKSEFILEFKNLKKYFPVYGGIFLRQKAWIYSVDDISLEIKKGETLGLVGESGCGKTTLGRCIAGLYNLTSGDIMFHGKSISDLNSKELKKMRLNMQMIFQDPFESLNPRHTISQILREKFVIHNKKDKELDIKIIELLNKVGLSKNAMEKFPHEFSGGQRQRIGIARAISLNPDMIICDEPVSALDILVQSQILNLLLVLQKQMKLTYIFISHDLSVVKHISDRIAVMYLGKIVEIADADSIYENPCHPYTKALLSAIPVVDFDTKAKTSAKKIILRGEIPSPQNPPKGCSFHTRCVYAQDVCKQDEPLLKFMEISNKNHYVACHF